MKYTKEAEKQALLTKFPLSSEDKVNQLDDFLGKVSSFFNLSYKTPFYKYLPILLQAALEKNEEELERIRSKFAFEIKRKPDASLNTVASQLLENLAGVQNVLADENSAILPLAQAHIKDILQRLEEEKNNLLGRLLQAKARKDMRAIKEGKNLDINDWESYQFLQETKKLKHL